MSGRKRIPLPLSHYPMALYFAVLSGIHLIAGLFSERFYMHGRTEVPLSRLPSGNRLMVALAFGQSNAANYGNSMASASKSVYNFYAGTLYKAQDPMLGADGPGGSVWTRLGDKLITAGLYDTVVFVPIAVGGSAMDQWTPEGVYHRKILDAIDSLKESRLMLTHLLWHQGETDAMYQTPGHEYKAMFLTMLTSIRDHGITAPVYVSVATRVGDYVDPEIQQAQRELVDPSRDIYAGPDTDTIAMEHRYDGTHLSESGLERAAELWLEQLRVR